MKNVSRTEIEERAFNAVRFFFFNNGKTSDIENLSAVKEIVNQITNFKKLESYHVQLIEEADDNNNQRAVKSIDESTAVLFDYQRCLVEELESLIYDQPKCEFKVDYCDYHKHENGGGLIHPTAKVEPGAFISSTATVEAEAEVESGVKIGGDTVIDRGAKVKLNATIGNCVKLGRNVIVFEDVKIGDQVKIGEWSSICYASSIGFQTVIGDDVWIGAQTRIGSFSKIDKKTIFEHGVTSGEEVMFGPHCKIQARSIIGSGAKFLDHSFVEEGSTIKPNTWFFGPEEEVNES